MMGIDAKAGTPPAIDPLIEEMPPMECAILARAAIRVVIWPCQFDKLAAAKRLANKRLLVEGALHSYEIEFQPTERGQHIRKALKRLGYAS